MEDLFRNVNDLFCSEKIKKLEYRFNNLSKENQINVLNQLSNIINYYETNSVFKNNDLYLSKEPFDILSESINKENIDEKIKELRSKFF